MPKRAVKKPAPAPETSPTPAPAPMPSKEPWLWPILVVAAVALAASVNSLANGFVTDDEILIRQNQDLASWATVLKGFTGSLLLPWVYRPIIFLSFFFDYRLTGLNPLGYHVTNVLYHAGVVVLLYVWARLLLPDRRVALAGALLFAVLPIHSESVAWIAGRSDVICGFFYLAALCLATWAVRGEHLRAEPYWGSVGVFGLAMLAKEMSATMPAVFGLSMLAFNLPRGVPWRRRWWLFVPYGVVLGLYFLARNAAIGGVMVGQSQSAIPGVSIATTLQAAPLVALWYVWLMVQPNALRLYYAIPESQALATVSWIGMAAVLAGIVWAWRRHRPWAFLAGWYLVAVAPVLLIPSDPRVADHFAYVPSIGFALLVGGLAVAALDWARRAGSPSLPRLAGVGLVALLAVLGGMTVQRNTLWTDSLVFYSRMVDDDPSMVIAHTNKGGELFRRGRYEEALAELQVARKLAPHSSLVLTNLAGVFYQTQRFREAIPLYQEAIAASPQEVKPYLYLARSLLATKQPAAALQVLAEADRRWPGQPAFRKEMGVAYQQQKKYGQAEKVFRSLLEQAGPDPELAMLLGGTLAAAGKPDEALTLAASILKANPGAAPMHYLAATVFERQGRLPEARRAYERYLAAQPDSPLAKAIKRHLQELGKSPAARKP